MPTCAAVSVPTATPSFDAGAGRAGDPAGVRLFTAELRRDCDTKMSISSTLPTLSRSAFAASASAAAAALVRRRARPNSALMRRTAMMPRTTLRSFFLAEISAKFLATCAGRRLLVAEVSHGCASASSAVSRALGSTTSSFEMRSFALALILSQYGDGNE